MKKRLADALTSVSAKEHQHLNVALRADGTTIKVPLIILKGENKGSTLLVDACAHGDEVEGTLAVLSIARSLDPKDMAGVFIGVPALNIPAFEGRDRVSPLLLESSQLRDMNRVFPGKAGASLTEKIALEYCEELAFKSDYVISFHGAGNNLYWAPRIHVPTSDEALDLAKAMGKGWYIQKMGLPYPGAITNVLERRGIPSILPEIAGGGGRLPDLLERNVGFMRDSVLNVMKYLGMLRGKPEYPKMWDIIEVININADNGGVFTVESGLKLRDKVEEGSKLGKVVDLYGEVTHEVVAPCNGIVIGYRTNPCTHAGDRLFKIGRIIEVIKR